MSGARKMATILRILITKFFKHAPTRKVYDWRLNSLILQLNSIGYLHIIIWNLEKIDWLHKSFLKLKISFSNHFQVLKMYKIDKVKALSIAFSRQWRKTSSCHNSIILYISNVMLIKTVVFRTVLFCCANFQVINWCSVFCDQFWMFDFVLV